VSPLERRFALAKRSYDAPGADVCRPPEVLVRLQTPIPAFDQDVFLFNFILVVYA